MRYITPEALIKNRLGSNPLPQWFAAILCFQGPKNSQPLVQEFNAQPLGYSIFLGLGESQVYEVIVGDRRVGILTGLVGAGPQAAILVEELAYLDVKYLIGYGAAGAIDPRLPKGQQVVAKLALPTDGTSQIYCPDSKEIAADPELIELVVNVGKSLSCDIQQVTAATVDALYRETESLISTWREKGAQIINMETTPFYAASGVCGRHSRFVGEEATSHEMGGIKSVWFGHISDRLIKGKWEDWYVDRDEMSSESARICLEFMNSLVQQGI